MCMKIKTAELVGSALDYAVGKIDQPEWTDEDLLANLQEDDDGDFYGPSVNWRLAGPIIERECICTYASGACSVQPKNPDYWVAEILDTAEIITQYGPTPLIAAMRCFVASRLGEEVEIPERM